MNKFNKLIILTISALVAFSTSLLADKPRDWQLGFQEPASQSMGEIVTVLVGPEGDFSPTERELILNGSTTVAFSLSKNILRTDTAVISAISLVNFITNQH